MSEMIIPHHIKSLFAEKLCKLIIPFDIFHHSVADLQNSSDFSLGFPLYRMNLGVSILGWEIELISSCYFLTCHLILCNHGMEQEVCTPDV